MSSPRRGSKAPRRARGKGGAGAPRKITLLLADDHALVRQGVKALLEAEPDIAVVGEARDGREAAEMAARLRPDVVVMDIAMPTLNGIEAARQIRKAVPSTRILILTAHSDDEYVARAADLGVSGYLLKQCSLEDLATAIRAAREGKAFFSPTIPAGLRGRFGGTEGVGSARAEPAARLTAREAELLQRIAEGRSNKESAAALGISVKTVEKHRQSLMKKLDIHDVAGLTRYAIATGSIEGRKRGATW